MLSSVSVMESALIDITWIFTQWQVYANYLLWGIPIFFIWKWFFKKLNLFPNHRLTATALTTVITTPLLCAAIGLVVIYIISYQPRRDFEQAEWSSNTKRYEMADDLIEQRILEGKDSFYVKKFIGPPRNRTDSTYQIELRNCWMYDMGMGPWGFGVKFHTLIVKYEKDKVLSVSRGGTVD